MASEHRLIEFFEIFREGCFQGDFFFGIFSAGHGREGAGSRFTIWKRWLKFKFPCVECSTGKKICCVR